ncbi:hypothetical protein TWF694_001906 [Orbilia ellipsospora]|uniref:Uncharacterized protein n=1 Tax=Orbilia ellipsospora TaxID=2528407 RepID=A0AAV9X6I6_9PEZI
MPRPPRRVPSKKAVVTKGRVAKTSAKPPPRQSTAGKRKSTDSTRPGRRASGVTEGGQDNVEPVAKKRRVSGGVTKPGSGPRLVARKKRILVEDFDSKWISISDSSVTEISKLLRDVGRSVVLDMPLKSAAKREEAQKTLDRSYQKFERSLAKMKIPPSTTEKVFNNEWLINEEARLNGLIQPETKQINLLQKEISKQKRLLENEERQLLTLQKNAKAEKEIRRQKAQKFIPAMKAPPMDPDELQIEIDKIRLDSNRSEKDFSIAQDLLEEDEELRPTMRQLEKHLTSIAKSRQVLGDMPEWIQSTRAAVDDVLYRLKGDQYGDLMDLTV